MDGCLTSGRVVGLVKLHYTKRSVVKRRPPLTVDQVKALEQLVCDDKQASMDRLAAGCFLLMVYGRLRFSDMQRITNMTLDTTVVGTAEVGFLECLAERTKTSLSLERKVRAPSLAWGRSRGSRSGWTSVAPRASLLGQLSRLLELAEDGARSRPASRPGVVAEVSRWCWLGRCACRHSFL